MEAIQLTKLEQRVLSELRGNEMTRTQLAERLGRKALNPHDINVLEGLVSRGMVVKREVVTGTVATTNFYSAK